jgi:hypothetical protein
MKQQLFLLAAVLLLTSIYCEQKKFGVLKRAWSTYGVDFGSTEFSSSEIDSDGNVFAFYTINAKTTQIDVNTIVTKPTKLQMMFAVVKYSPSGKVLWYSIPDTSITTARSSSTSQMILKDGKLIVSAAVQAGVLKVQDFNVTSLASSVIVINYDADTGKADWHHYFSCKTQVELSFYSLAGDNIIIGLEAIGSSSGIYSLLMDGKDVYTVTYKCFVVVSLSLQNGSVKWVQGADYKGEMLVSDVYGANFYQATSEVIYVAAGISGSGSKMIINGNSTSIDCSYGYNCIVIIGWKLIDGSIKIAKLLGTSDVSSLFLQVYNEEIYILGTFEGDKYIANTTEYTNSGDKDIFLVKYNTVGTLAFAHVLGGTKADEANGLFVNTNGILISGSFLSAVTIGTTSISGGQKVNEYVSMPTIALIKYKLDGTFDGIIDSSIALDSSVSIDNDVIVVSDAIIDATTFIISLNVKRVTLETGTIKWNMTLEGIFYSVPHIQQITQSKDGEVLYLGVSFPGISIPQHGSFSDKGCVILTVSANDGTIITVSDPIIGTEDMEVKSLVVHGDDLYLSITTTGQPPVTIGTEVDNTTVAVSARSVSSVFGVLSNFTDLCLLKVENCVTCSSYTICKSCSPSTKLSNNQCIALKCYGVKSTDPIVCSGKGHCVDSDKCCCQSGSAGHNCAREKNDEPYYYEYCWK